MFIYRRFALLIGILAVALVLLGFKSRDSIKSSRIWKEMPQKVGLGEWMADEEEDGYGPEREAIMESSLNITYNAGELITSDGAGLTSDPFKFPPAILKPPGSVYTKAIVLGRLPSENMTWLTAAALPVEVQMYLYGIDDPQAVLQAPKNKGREAMIYLTYIIDHYDALPDVSIFLHAHQSAWHNNELLNHDAIEMIKRLSSERVTREGYMNLRCHWKPGCPEWLKPGAVYMDVNRPEEVHMAEAWATLFPGEPIPANIGSACCAQFAVSRERIRSVPLSSFHHYRNWLLRTPLPDDLSGRVFEYLWAKIFTQQTTFCPDQRICYCDGYGVCFEDEKEFDYWFELKYNRGELLKRLDSWERQARWLEKARVDWGSLEEKEIVIPLVDEDIILKREINSLSQELERRRLDALRKGVDPQVRARIAGRPWKDGDGY